MPNRLSFNGLFIQFIRKSVRTHLQKETANGDLVSSRCEATEHYEHPHNEKNLGAPKDNGIQEKPRSMQGRWLIQVRIHCQIRPVLG